MKNGGSGVVVVSYSSALDAAYNFTGNVSTYVTSKDDRVYVFYSSGSITFGCVAGERYNNQSNACEYCFPGTYQGADLQTYCISCDEGYSQPSEGQSSCNPCDPGSVKPQIGQSDCILCNPGTYQNSTGQTSCSSCEEGLYQDLFGSTSCKSCPTTHYSESDLGSTTCSMCPYPFTRSRDEYTRCSMVNLRTDSLFQLALICTTVILYLAGVS